MLKISTKEDLQRLVDEEVPESLILDYKASPSLARDDKPRDELCKDVSAFANSAGGQIIYGIVEKDRKPVKVDERGCDCGIREELAACECEGSMSRHMTTIVVIVMLVAMVVVLTGAVVRLENYRYANHAPPGIVISNRLFLAHQQLPFEVIT
jgi:predicted HTH transcriptional regulator